MEDQMAVASLEWRPRLDDRRSAILRRPRLALARGGQLALRPSPAIGAKWSGNIAIHSGRLRSGRGWRGRARAWPRRPLATFLDASVILRPKFQKSVRK